MPNERDPRARLDRRPLIRDYNIRNNRPLPQFPAVTVPPNPILARPMRRVSGCGCIPCVQLAEERTSLGYGCSCPLCLGLMLRRFPDLEARLLRAYRIVARRFVSFRRATGVARRTLDRLRERYREVTGFHRRRAWADGAWLETFSNYLSCGCGSQHCPACNQRGSGTRLSWADPCGNCACRRCYPVPRECRRCACGSCYPSGRPDCINAHCRECRARGIVRDPCSDPECGTCNRPHDYSYRPEPIFSSLRRDGREHRAPYAIESQAYYGIEVEAERGSRITDGAFLAIVKKQADYLYVKTDSSLLGRGLECVSHPATFAAWCARGPELAWANALRKAGCISFNTDTCGMHVHVSRSAMSEAAQAKLLLFFARYTSAIAKWSRRKAELLARYATLEVDGGKAIVCKVKNFGATEAGPRNPHGYRYTAVNLTNQATIEIRIFRGTLISRSIMCNIGLVEALVTFAKSTPANAVTMSSFLAHVRHESESKLRTKREREVLADTLRWIEPTVDVNAGRNVSAQEC